MHCGKIGSFLGGPLVLASETLDPSRENSGAHNNSGKKSVIIL